MGPLAVSKENDGLSLLGRPARYPTGLQELGGGVFAWLQPNGDLGESNAGLIVAGGESLLVDTLWDLRLTRRMLQAMAPLTSSSPIRRLVNTHGDPDHVWGNQLVEGVEIVATRAGGEDMLREDPRALRMLSRLGGGARLLDRSLLIPGLGKLRGLTRYARLLQAYDFAGINPTGATQTFTGSLALDVGGRRIDLIELGPAHTPGDLIVHVPDAQVVFAADLLFVGVTPIMWVGPVENWLSALERIVELDPKTVVPGHGPVSDLDGVRAMGRYWEFVAGAVRERVAAGLTPYQAARDITRSSEFAQEEFSGWDARERLAVNAEIIALSDRGRAGRVSDRARLRLIANVGELGAELG
jgi:glyoxylase-like metal-dependent hydrolase (beta-lactamase superfamily II)